MKDELFTFPATVYGAWCGEWQLDPESNLAQGTLLEKD